MSPSWLMPLKAAYNCSVMGLAVAEQRLNAYMADPLNETFARAMA